MRELVDTSTCCVVTWDLLGFESQAELPKNPCADLGVTSEAGICDFQRAIEQLISVDESRLGRHTRSPIIVSVQHGADISCA